MIKKIVKKLIVQFKYPELRRLPHAPEADEVHLKAAVDWLCTAQDATDDGGVSATYDIWKKRWAAPYRETTGYIIETFLEYYHLTGEKEYLERAIRMGEWEISVQAADGAVWEERGGEAAGKKIFNTSQVMLGYNALYKETSDAKYLEASKKGAEWLMNNQEADGRWQKFSTNPKQPAAARTINARSAWALLQLYAITGENSYKAATEKNIEWILRQQRKNFWFDNTSLTEQNRPWTHYIAYTICGLLECYVLLGKSDKKLFTSFYGAATTLLEYYRTHGSELLPGSFDSHWESQDTYTCITGDAQIAIAWMQVYELTGEQKFLDGARNLLEQVKMTQLLSDRPETHGGILGSYPIDGLYGPYSIINWGAKFFADALMLKTRITSS
ncbi:MAG: glycoside hydrolase family 127 protein [bacterium]|nr:glycoside hydrolase family 127 protein [bacterium]